MQYPDQQIGALAFHAATPRCWSEHEAATLLGVAEYLAVALRNAYAQQERARAEATLADVNAELATSVQMANQLAIIAEAANQAKSAFSPSAPPPLPASRACISKSVRFVVISRFRYNVPAFFELPRTHVCPHQRPPTTRKSAPSMSAWSKPMAG